MPVIVEHPELGEIEFPDGMSQEDILKAIDAHSNKGFEVPQPGDEDISTGLPAGGEPPRSPVPEAPTTAGMFAAPPMPQPFPMTAAPPLPANTLLEPWKYVPQDVGTGPIEAGTFDEQKKKDLAQIDAYYNGLKGSDDAKNAQLEAMRQEALKAEGVKLVGEDPFKLKLPRVESSDLQTLGLGKTASDIAAGAQHAAVGGAEFFGTPEGVSLLATGKLPVPSDVHRLIAGGFSAQMASQMPGQIKEAAKAWKAGDVERATELTASTVLSGLFSKEGFESARGTAVNPLYEIGRIKMQLPNAEPTYREHLLKRQEALQKKVNASESTLKDAGTDRDIDVTMSPVDPTTGQPWEGGTYAKMDSDGSLQVDPENFHDILKDLSPAKQKTFIESLVDEEFLHSKLTNEDALQYWNSLSGAEQAVVRKRYAGNAAGQFTDSQLGHEALRARLQQLSAVTPREIAEAHGLAIAPRALLAIESALTKARQVMGTAGSKSQQAIFNRVQETIKAAREKLNVNAERAAIDAGEEGVPAAEAPNENMPFATRRTPAVQGVEDMIDEGIGLKDQTRRSYALGKQVTTKAEVKDLIRLREEKKDEFDALRAKLQSASKEERMQMMMDPVIGEKIGTLTIHGGQLVNEVLEKATGSVPSKMEPGEKAPVPMTQAELDALTSEVRKEIDASKNAATTEVHGDVQPQPGEGQREVPAAESGGGIQPREEPAQPAAEEAPQVLRLEPPKETAAAFRKKPVKGSEEELPLAPGTKDAPRNTEELGLPQPERESVTPRKIEEISTEHLASAKPSFDRFVEDVRKRFGSVQPGQIADAWEDAVWKKLIDAPGSELEALVKKFGLTDRFGSKKEGVEPGSIPDVREKTQPRSSSTAMFPKPALTVLEHPPRRANAIARIAEKLIAQSKTKRADLKRKGITPDEIGWWRPRAGDEPAFMELTPEQAKASNVGTLLTQGGSMERGGGRVTSGFKGYPETVTKRLVALQDRATGRMELVSIYRTGRGAVLAADPTKMGERIHTPIQELLGKKTIAGEQRYVPRFSVLLDEPVQGFRESFKSEAEFQEKFGSEAAEHQRRMEEAEAEAEEIGPQKEGKPPEKGILFRQEKTSEDSFRALHDILGGAEEVTQESLQDNLEDLFAENRPKDTKTGQPRALTIRELKGVDALLFAQDRMMEMAREKGTPISPEAALSNVLDYIHENKDLARSDFARKAVQTFAPEQSHVPAPTGELPGRTAKEAETGARELTLRDEGRKAIPAEGTGTGPKAYLSGKDNPAAFRKPSKQDVLWGAEKAWNSIKAQVGGEALRNPIARQITAWRDAADNIPSNLGRKAERGLEVELPVNDELHRAAVLAYRETRGGDSVLLDNARASVEIGLNDFRAAKNSEAVRQGELMLRAIDFVRNNGPAVARANSFFSKTVSDEFNAERARGIEVTRRDEYTPHVYNADGFTDDALIFPSRILGHKFTASQQFGSYFSAYENGFYPKKYDAAAVLANRVRRGQRQVQNRLWMERVKNTIDPVSGEAIAVESVPYDVTMASGRVETRYKPPSPEYDLFSVSPGQKPIAIRKGYKDLMDVLTMQSPLQKSAIGRAALNYNGFLKHSVILIYDTFHPSRIGQYGMAALGMKPKLWEIGNRGAAALDYPDAQMDKAVAKGYISQDSVDWARATESVRIGAATVDLTHRQILEYFEKEGLNVGRISDALYREMTDNIPFVGALNRFTFDKLTRGTMAGTAVSEFIRQNKKFPDYDGRQLMRDIVRDVNFRFGNIGRQGLLRNPAIRDLAQLGFLAPQWVEGMAQSEARFYARLLKAPFTVGNGKPNMGTIGRIMGRGLAFYFGLTQVLNLITKGQTTFQNEEGHKFDAWIPDFTGKTPGFYFSPLSVFAEVTHDIIKSIGKSNKSIDGLSHIVGNKLGPLGRVLSTFMFRETPEGEKITTTAGVLKQAASELFPAPISLSKLSRGAGNLIAPNMIAPAKPGDVQRQAFASAGFKIDPAETALQTIRDKAEAFVKKNHLKREDSEFQLTDQAFYTQLRRAVRTDQNKEAMRLIEKLRDEHGDRAIEKAMQRYAKRMFTGSRQHERMFVASLDDKQQAMYEKARDEQADQFEKFLALWDKKPERKED